MYALIKTNMFVQPPEPEDPPPIPTICNSPSTQDLQASVGESRNYYLLYVNISRACFRMLDELVPDQYKVSNNPNLLGWNQAMSIQLILAQLENLYGKPMANIIWNNNILFTTNFNPVDAPETLFHQSKQCQEVAIIGATPYTAAQLVNNMMHLLLKSGIFSTREFKSWDAIPNKTWPVLKTFVHGAYARKLVALNIRNMTGQQGYVPQNMYHVLDRGNDTSNTNMMV